jgi:UDP-glucose 4-epimerase
MVIPNFVRQALAGEPLIVHGTGSQTRSFTWVGDVVWALLALIAEPRSVGQVFNIGNGEEVSIRQLARMIIAKTGSSSPIRFVPHHEVFGQNFEDMSRRVPDIGKLQQLTGYKPRVDLDEILERVIDYWSPELPPLESRAEAPFWHEPGELFVH